MGQVKLNNHNLYQQKVKSLEGKYIELIIRKQKSIRSLALNSYYWGVVVDLIANHIGYKPEECHESLKNKFASEEDVLTGLIKVESTASWDNERFIKYMDDIKQWAAMFLDLYIPDPNEYL